MLRKNKIWILSVMLISCFSWASTARLADIELVNLFQGKDIFFDMREKDNTTGWDSAHFRFLDNGDMVGYLFSSDFLSTKSPNNDVDGGLWLIRENMVCILWSQWNESVENCYSIHLNDDIYVAQSDGGGLFKGEFDPQY